MRKSRVGDVRDRFFDRFDIAENGCWIWNATLIKMGRYFYGAIAGKIDGVRYVKTGINMGAHRVSWILHYGAIPAGEGSHGTVVMHKCDNPLCVNPEHLMLGSQQDNVADMNAKKRGSTVGFVVATGTKHRNSRLTAEQLQYVLTSERSAPDIAKEYGVSRHLISDVRCGKRYKEETNFEELQELAKTRKGRVRNGGENPFSKLTDDQVRYIRTSTKTTYVIAEEFNVSQPTIANARRRATYKNVV